MSEKFEEALNGVVSKIGAAVANAAELKVQTWFLTIDEDEGAAQGAGAGHDFEAKKRPLARTIVKVDGDSESIVPMRRTEDGLTVDKDLLDMHNKNVDTARQYRTDIINMFLGLVT